MNDWYMDELIPLLLQTPDLDEDRVLIARGRFPDPGGFAGRLFNEHSGGHYTEDFNRYWAAGICDILEQQGLLE